MRYFTESLIFLGSFAEPIWRAPAPQRELPGYLMQPQLQSCKTECPCKGGLNGKEVMSERRSRSVCRADASSGEGHAWLRPARTANGHTPPCQTRQSPPVPAEP